MILKYRSEIDTYLNHRKQREIVLNNRQKNYCHQLVNSTNLQMEIEQIIDSSDGNDNDIISIHEAIQKFNDLLPHSCVKDVIDSIHYRYGDKYAVIEDAYLISNSKIKDLKPLLTTGITYSDARDIFAKNNIPEFCYNALIRKLGFEFDMRKRDYRNPTIVEKQNQA